MLNLFVSLLTLCHNIVFLLVPTLNIFIYPLLSGIYFNSLVFGCIKLKPDLFSSSTHTKYKRHPYLLYAFVCHSLKPPLGYQKKPVILLLFPYIDLKKF